MRQFIVKYQNVFLIRFHAGGGGSVGEYTIFSSEQEDYNAREVGKNGENCKMILSLRWSPKEKRKYRKSSPFYYTKRAFQKKRPFQPLQ